jgi:FtsP/CotA-like multicopper oxidase with cupredoxin domain
VKVLEAKPSLANIPSSLRVIEPLAPQEAAINRKVKLSVGASLKNGMNFLINNGLHVLDEPVKVGELQVWEIDNVSLMDHPFHLHGSSSRYWKSMEKHLSIEHGKTPSI